MRWSHRQLADCASREAEWRKQVYPGRVRARKLDAVEAARQIGMMLAIAAHFEALAAKDAPQLPFPKEARR